MVTKIKVQFTSTAWDESGLIVLDNGVKVTQVKAAFEYKGAVDGHSSVNYLMQYNADGTGVFSGYEYLKASIDSVPGEVVFFHEGTFDKDGVVMNSQSVFDGSSGGFAGKRLKGNASLVGHGPYDLELVVDS